MSRLARVRWSLVAIVMLVCAEARAGATVRLAYSRSPEASECPTEEELQAAIVARLGYNPFDPSGKSTVIAMVHRQGGELRASVNVVDERGDSRGRRDLETAGNDCEALARALALTISIAIDPERANAPEAPPAEPADREGQPSSPARADAAAPPPAQMPASTPSAALAPTARPSVRGPPVPGQKQRPSRAAKPRLKSTSLEARPFAGALLLGTVGVVPGLTPGADLFGGVEIDGLAFGVELRGVVPALGDFDAGGQFRAWVVAGGLSPCYLLGPVWFCGVALAGVLRADSSRVRSPDGDSGVYAALGGRARFVQRLTDRLGLAVQGELLGTLAPVALELDGKAEWSAPPASGSVGLGLLSRFR